MREPGEPNLFENAWHLAQPIQCDAIGFSRIRSSAGLVSVQESEVFLEVMFRDTTDIRQSLPKNTMAVLLRVGMCVADHVDIIVGDGQTVVHSFDVFASV